MKHLGRWGLAQRWGERPAREGVCQAVADWPGEPKLLVGERGK